MKEYSEKFITEQIENSINELISGDAIDDEQIDDMSLLLEAMLRGDCKGTIGLINPDYYNRLVLNGCIENNVFSLTTEDLKYPTVWLIMTLLVAKGLVEKKYE